MELRQELVEIKNKDITIMSENELREYRLYLDDLNKNTEVKLEKCKKVSKYSETILSLIAGCFSLYGLYYLLTTIMVKPILLSFFVSAVLLEIVNILRRKFKKTEKYCQNIKEVCSSKLIEVNRKIDEIDIKRELETAKNAQITAEDIMANVSDNGTKKE